MAKIDISTIPRTPGITRWVEIFTDREMPDLGGKIIWDKVSDSIYAALLKVCGITKADFEKPGYKSDRI